MFGRVLAHFILLVCLCELLLSLWDSLGIWNLIQIIFVLFGALLGGLLADINWRLAMLLVPLLGSLCAVLAFLLPPMRANTKLLVNIPGLLGIALAMVLFLFGVSHALMASVTISD